MLSGTYIQTQQSTFRRCTAKSIITNFTFIVLNVSYAVNHCDKVYVFVIINHPHEPNRWLLRNDRNYTEQPK